MSSSSNSQHEERICWKRGGRHLQSVERSLPLRSSL